MNNSINNMTKIIKVILNEPSLRLKDISDLTGLNTSNVFKIMKAMEAGGYVIRDPVDKKYTSGPLLQKIAYRIWESDDVLISCSYNELSKLRRYCSETVGIFKRVGPRRVVIVELTHGRNFIVTMKNSYAAIYTGASGLILLSEMPEDKLKKLLDNIELVPVGFNTITDRDVLMQKLKSTKAQGYAISSGTVTRNQFVTGLAVPIKNYPIPLALAVYGQQESFGSKVNDSINATKECAEKISANLACWDMGDDLPVQLSIVR